MVKLNDLCKKHFKHCEDARTCKYKGYYLIIRESNNLYQSEIFDSEDTVIYNNIIIANGVSFINVKNKSKDFIKKLLTSKGA